MYRLPKTLLQLAVMASPLALAVEVSVPLTAPLTAPTLAGSLVSLSIEQDRWIDWAGTTSPNEFFYNALDNLVQITGDSPWIRIGADSEDHTDFSYDVEYEEDIFPASTAITPYPEASNITVGYSFYDIISHLPAGTHVHWGVNLGQYNLTAAYLETVALVEAFASSAVKEAGITLDYIEVGNEADLYSSNGLRNSSWNVVEYVSQWTQFATNVSQAAGLSASSYTKFIGGAFAGSSHSTTGFSPQGIFANGILDSTAGSLIKTISQHQYSASFCAGSGALLQDLLTPTHIHGNLTVFTPDINATYSEGLGYILGETNSISCHGAPGVSNTAGAALWLADYSLYASQVGITRLHFHEGIGYKYNLIQPVTLNYSTLDAEPIPPQAARIAPPYYGNIIVAEAIGNSGDAQAVALNVDSEYITGYAFFEHGALVRAVFINMETYLPGDTTRTSTPITFDFGSGFAPETFALKRLDIRYTNDTEHLFWGGQTYETADARVEGIEIWEPGLVSEGFTIRETEAVLVAFA